MAQFNITLDQDEIFQLLENDTGDAFRTLLQETLNTLMRTESREQLRADPYQRTEERTDSRNGSRERTLVTRIGRLELKVPRHRSLALPQRQELRSRFSKLATRGLFFATRGATGRNVRDSSRERLHLFTAATNLQRYNMEVVRFFRGVRQRFDC